MGERSSSAASEGARGLLGSLRVGDDVRDSQRVLSPIACAHPDFLRRLMAGTAAPARNRHRALVVMNFLTAGAPHQAIAAWTVHGSSMS